MIINSFVPLFYGTTPLKTYEQTLEVQYILLFLSLGFVRQSLM